MKHRNPKIELAVVVIGYNSKKFLKTCFDSIKKQTIFRKLDVIYIDNISHDDSPAFVLKNYPFVRVFQNHFNFGYSGGANQGIDLAGAPFISIMNPDMILEKDFYEKILRAMKKKNIGAATGKLYKYNFHENKQTSILDSTGLQFHGTTRVTDRGQGEKDEKQYDKKREVWGVSGACPVYRLEALTDVKKGSEYFDEDFFMYKEDVDLAWRLNRKGWKSIYDPSAIGHHGRGTEAYWRKGLSRLLKGRKKLSRFQKRYSYRNHWLMLIKNLRLFDIIRHPLGLLLFAIASPLNAIKEGVFLSGMKEIIKLTPKMLRKR